MTSERRAEPRHRTLKGAKIVINDGFSTFDCQVRNLSGHGAKLLAGGIIGIPQRFQLALADGRKFDCEMTWQNGQEIGVKFIPAP